MKKILILLLIITIVFIFVFITKETKITQPGFLQSDTIDIIPTRESLKVVKNDNVPPSSDPHSKDTPLSTEADDATTDSIKTNEDKDEVQYLTYKALKKSLLKINCGWENKSERTKCFENIKDFKSDGLKFIEENFEELEALREKYHHLLMQVIKTKDRKNFENMKLKIEGEHWFKRKWFGAKKPEINKKIEDNYNRLGSPEFFYGTFVLQHQFSKKSKSEPSLIDIETRLQNAIDKFGNN